MKNIDWREFIAGALFSAVGIAVALFASSHYQVGSAARMGPGYFPTMLGWVLAALGVVIALLSLRKTIHVIKPPPFTLRPFLAVIGAVALFALLVDRVGLIPTTILTVMVTASGSDSFRPGRALVLAICLAVIGWLIFSVGLKMTVPVFSWRV